MCVSAARIIPVVKNQHLLLVTLLICNAGCMETLPIFSDKLLSPVFAIVISVTLILFFGEVSDETTYRQKLLAKHYPVWLELLVRWLCGLILSHRNGRKATSPELAAEEDLTTVR
jgi:metal transporter CNNM